VRFAFAVRSELRAGSNQIELHRHAVYLLDENLADFNIGANLDWT